MCRCMQGTGALLAVTLLGKRLRFKELFRISHLVCDTFKNMSYFSSLLTQDIYSVFLLIVTSTGLDITATLELSCSTSIKHFFFGGGRVLKINYLAF